MTMMIGGKSGHLRGNARRLQLVVASALAFFAATLGPAVAAEDKNQGSIGTTKSNLRQEVESSTATGSRDLEFLGGCKSDSNGQYCCCNGDCPSDKACIGGNGCAPLVCACGGWFPSNYGYCKSMTGEPGAPCRDVGDCNCSGADCKCMGLLVLSASPDRYCTDNDGHFPPGTPCTQDGDCDLSGTGNWCNGGGATSTGVCEACPDYCFQGQGCNACNNNIDKILCGRSDFAAVMLCALTGQSYDPTTRPLPTSSTTGEEEEEETGALAADLKSATGAEWEYYGMTFRLEATNLCSIGNQAAIEAAVMAELQSHAINTADRSVTYTDMTLTSGCGVNEAADPSSSVAVSESRRNLEAADADTSITASYTFQTYGYCRGCITYGLPGAYSINAKAAARKDDDAGATLRGVVDSSASSASAVGVTYGGVSVVDKDTSSSGTSSEAAWYDSDGPYYDCDWYGGASWYCGYFGNNYRNFGLTANEACTVCGGGSSSRGSTSKSRARLPNEDDVRTILLKNNEKSDDASAAAAIQNDGTCSSDDDCGHPHATCNPCGWADDAAVCLPVDVPHGEACSCDAECTSGTCHTELDVPICA